MGSGSTVIGVLVKGCGDFTVEAAGVFNAPTACTGVSWEDCFERRDWGLLLVLGFLVSCLLLTFFLVNWNTGFDWSLRSWQEFPLSS